MFGLLVGCGPRKTCLVKKTLTASCLPQTQLVKGEISEPGNHSVRVSMEMGHMGQIEPAAHDGVGSMGNPTYKTTILVLDRDRLCADIGNIATVATLVAGETAHVLLGCGLRFGLPTFPQCLHLTTIESHHTGHRHNSGS